MAWFRRSPQTRSASIADPNLAVLLGYQPLDGVTVSESSVMTLSAVWRAVSLVSDAVASLPLRTLQRGSEGTQERTSSFLDSPGGELYTPHEWTSQVMVHLLLHGNAYLLHVRNGAGAMASLQPIHPSQVTTEWAPSRPGGKKHKVRGEVDGRAEMLELDSRSITHIMGISLDGLTGLSAISAARLSLSTGISGDRSAQRLFAHGAMISGLVTPADEDMTESEAEQVKEHINRRILGPENAGDIAVVNRRLNFQAWSLSAEDAQFLQSRQFQIDEVARWFGVPGHLLNQLEKQTSWGTGVAEQNRGLARYTLQSWTSRIEQRLSRLLPPSRQAEYDYTGYLQPAPEDEIRLLIEQMNSGLLTLNEARRIRNLPAVEGGDENRLPPGSNPPPSDGGSDEEV